MATGKNKILRWMRIIVGAANLSGDARTFEALLNEVGEADLMGWNNAAEHVVRGSARKIGLTGFQALLNDTAVTGALTVLKDAENTSRLSVLFGGGAEPAAGDPAYLLGPIQLSDVAGLDGLAAVIKANFRPDAGQHSDLAENPLGVVLHPETSLSATTNGSTIDNEASSPNGAHANLHVLASSGGTWALTVEHSTDGNSWSTLMTFTSTGGAVTSERKTASGTINRYVRFVATRTSGTLTPVVTFARN